MIARKFLILATLAATSAFAADPAAQPAAGPKPLSHELTRAEFEQLLTKPNELLIIDLRRPDELTRIGGFPVYLSIQAKDLEQQLAWIPKDRTIVTVSNHAARSGRAADLLTAKGFKVAGLLGAQTYEEQGGKLTKIEVPERAAPAECGGTTRHEKLAHEMSEAAVSRKVWDLPVRIVHWLLVFGIAGSYVTHKLGVAYFKYHAWFGYLVVILAGFRILWGIVGTRHARFAQFLRGPRATWRYFASLLQGQAPATPGHNPLGAWMVVFLLLGLLAQGITGLLANDEIFNTGPLYGYVSDATSLKLTSWHRQLFDWILIAIALHVIAVVAHRVFAGHDLVGPMFSGKKPAGLIAEHEAISSSRLWLALVLMAALVAIVSWLIVQAPAPAAGSFE